MLAEDRHICGIRQQFRRQGEPRPVVRRRPVRISVGRGRLAGIRHNVVARVGARKHRIPAIRNTGVDTVAATQSGFNRAVVTIAVVDWI